VLRTCWFPKREWLFPDFLTEGGGDLRRITEGTARSGRSQLTARLNSQGQRISPERKQNESMWWENPTTYSYPLHPCPPLPVQRNNTHTLIARTDRPRQIPAQFRHRLTLRRNTFTACVGC
jgi:hypothetical protein